MSLHSTVLSSEAKEALRKTDAGKSLTRTTSKAEKGSTR
jgi:hypothetical protein